MSKRRFNDFTYEFMDDVANDLNEVSESESSDEEYKYEKSLERETEDVIDAVDGLFEYLKEYADNRGLFLLDGNNAYKIFCEGMYKLF